MMVQLTRLDRPVAAALLAALVAACPEPTDLVDTDAGATCTASDGCTDGGVTADAAPQDRAASADAAADANTAVDAASPDTVDAALPPCADDLDNDGDGWIDRDDPDCSGGDAEVGHAGTSCNDGVDNDGDGDIDGDDSACATATDDEVLGAGPCRDVCVVDLPRESDGAICTLWDTAEQQWQETADQGAGHMHHRARWHTHWVRKWFTPADAIVCGTFTDLSYTEILHYGREGDASIYTGTYLGAEAFRYMATGDPEAHDTIDRTVRYLHHAWNVSGCPGMLARYAVRSDSPRKITDYFDEDDLADHIEQPYDGELWNWTGAVSRDQYQGVFFGFSLAYEATEDPELREIIREDVVEAVEQLMRLEDRQIDLVINGIPIPTTLEMDLVITCDRETDSGVPSLFVDTSNYAEMEHQGIVIFWPDPAAVFQQIPGFSWLPSVPLPTQAVQLLSHFQVALQVTDGVPEYAARRQAIQSYYESRFEELFDIADGWTNTSRCGEAYFGNNIVMKPMYNLARLETDPVRGPRIRGEVLRDKLWDHMFDHKNVFFAYIYASQAPAGEDVTEIVSFHTDQLDQFPIAPQIELAADLTDLYGEDPSCPGKSPVAIDVGDRLHENYIWGRDPWELIQEGDPTLIYPAYDYLLAYWMGRHYGYIEDDSPDVCAQWRE